MWLFLSITALVALGSLLLSKFRKIPLKTIVSLLLFGILLSVPFVMVEFFSASMKFYLVILAFIVIEFLVLFFEKRIKLFHDLIHHNVKHLRIASFILIGIGFTYGEISATILHNAKDTHEIVQALPFKAAFGILTHTVLTSAASLIHVGTLFAETIYESVLRFFSYYLRIAIISISHYLYVFFVENELSIIIMPFLIMNIVLFFWLKSNLDKKALLNLE